MDDWENRRKAYLKKNFQLNCTSYEKWVQNFIDYYLQFQSVYGILNEIYEREISIEY